MTEEFSLTEINRPSPENMTDMMRKHTPLVEIPDKVKAGQPFAVTLKVGGIDGVEHPNLLGHWINWVELHAGQRLLGRAEFAPVVSQPEATLHVTLEAPATLRALASCNLHGLWESTRSVALK